MRTAVWIANNYTCSAGITSSYLPCTWNTTFLIGESPGIVSNFAVWRCRKHSTSKKSKYVQALHGIARSRCLESLFPMPPQLISQSTCLYDICTMYGIWLYCCMYSCLAQKDWLCWRANKQPHKSVHVNVGLLGQRNPFIPPYFVMGICTACNLGCIPHYKEVSCQAPKCDMFSSLQTSKNSNHSMQRIEDISWKNVKDQLQRHSTIRTAHHCLKTTAQWVATQIYVWLCMTLCDSAVTIAEDLLEWGLCTVILHNRNGIGLQESLTLLCDVSHSLAACYLLR